MLLSSSSQKRRKLNKTVLEKVSQSSHLQQVSRRKLLGKPQEVDSNCYFNQMIFFTTLLFQHFQKTQIPYNKFDLIRFNNSIYKQQYRYQYIKFYQNLIKSFGLSKLMTTSPLKKLYPLMTTSPLKSKLKQFTNLQEKCYQKLSLLNNIQDHNRKNAIDIVSMIMGPQKIVEPPSFLDFTTPVNIILNGVQQKTIIIKGQVLKQRRQKGKILTIVFNSSYDVKVQLVLAGSFTDKKQNYKIKGTNAIYLTQYLQGDVKCILKMYRKVNAFVQVKVNLDTFTSQYQTKRISLPISPKKQKLEIDQYIKQNRGKSAQILKRRSLIRQKACNQSRLKSSQSVRNFNNNAIYRPISSTSHSKRQISDFHHFEDQKAKYFNHMIRMSQQKGEFLQQAQNLYKCQKNQQIQKLSAWILLSKFAQISRKNILQQHKKRFHKIKIDLLCLKFCHIMKQKLHFRISQKARYRMTIRQPIKMVGQIFHFIQVPRAQSILFTCLSMIQTFSTGKRLLQCAKTYIEQAIVIQRYFRHKKNNILARIDIIIDQIIIKQNINYTKVKRKELKQQYFQYCMKNYKRGTTGLYENIQFLQGKLVAYKNI